MQVLDLRNVRCPLALVLLKQFFLTLESANNSRISVLFSNQDAMSDIRLYLEQQKYSYCIEQYSLLIDV